MGFIAGVSSCSLTSHEHYRAVSTCTCKSQERNPLCPWPMYVYIKTRKVYLKHNPHLLLSFKMQSQSSVFLTVIKHEKLGHKIYTLSISNASSLCVTCKLHTLFEGNVFIQNCKSPVFRKCEFTKAVFKQLQLLVPHLSLGRPAFQCNF